MLNLAKHRHEGVAPEYLLFYKFGGPVQAAQSVKGRSALIAQRILIQVEGGLVADSDMQRNVRSVKTIRHCMICRKPATLNCLQLWPAALSYRMPQM